MEYGNHILGVHVVEYSVIFIFGEAGCLFLIEDRVFLGVTAMDPARGATIIEPEEAAVLRIMVRQAREVIVVADSSKLGMVSPAVICPPRDIDLLITDDGISEETERAFAASDIRVLAV